MTTQIFGLFPCDSLDNDKSMLRKDYSISCFDSDRTFWALYGWSMALVFLIGVVAMYYLVLRSKKARLMKSVDERLEDDEVRRGGRAKNEVTIEKSQQTNRSF